MLQHHNGGGGGGGGSAADRTLSAPDVNHHSGHMAAASVNSLSRAMNGGAAARKRLEDRLFPREPREGRKDGWKGAHITMIQ